MDGPYRHLYVPIDNSECSHQAIAVAMDLARAFGARVTGCHVYAAALHGYRFKQMEYTLPTAYRQEHVLEHQRRVHDSLIAMGLSLISECYVEAMGRTAAASGVPFEGKVINGRHYTALVADVRASDYDLVIMGARGMGAVKDTELGSVAARFVRRVTTDTLIVRAHDAGRARPIVVGLDGSAPAFTALAMAIALARATGRPLHAVAVHDPGRHESILDRAGVARASLRIARARAADAGVDLTATGLEGKGFEKLLAVARTERPWLLVLGRTGVHAEDGDVEPGSTTAMLLRLAPCNVLVSGGGAAVGADAAREEEVAATLSRPR